MKYTAAFVERLKAEFPDEPHLHQMAEVGSKDLPLMLKPSLESLTTDEILEYLRDGKANELQDRCEAHQRRLALYYEAYQFAFGSSPV